MEEDIASFASFTLKSGRITQVGSSDTSSSFSSIPLRAYSSSTMTRSSKPIFLFLALVAVIGAFYLYSDGTFSIDYIQFELTDGLSSDNAYSAILTLIAAIYFVYRYIKSRTASLVIETIGGQQFSDLVKGKHDGVEAFISSIERQYEAQFNKTTQ